MYDVRCGMLDVMGHIVHRTSNIKHYGNYPTPHLINEQTCSLTSFITTKTFCMKPEIILQSDVLDIVFENKNKAYGAYELRRHYNGRLIRAIIITLSVFLIFAVLQGWKIPHRVGTVEVLRLDTMKLIEVDIHKEIVPPKQLEVQQPKALAADNGTPPKIVPDVLVTKPIATVESLENKIITNHTNEGAPVGISENITLQPSGSGAPAATGVEELEPTGPIERPDLMPEFPGGTAALLKFMQRNLKEPDDLEQGQKLLVISRFVVDSSGNIVDIGIIRNGRKDLDEEVMRVVKKMPKWKPGMQHGHHVPVYFRLPVTFVSAE